jgi:hypothetical protein
VEGLASSMKALAITLPRNRWPQRMTNHFHIVDTYISRHVVGAIQYTYHGAGATVTEYEWKNHETAPACSECGSRFGETS